MAIQATFGTTVSIDGAAIGEAISITPPQVKIATIQTTNLSSADSAHTFIAGYTDSGEVTIEANYEKAEFDAVVTDPPYGCLLYTSPSPRDRQKSRMPSSA